MGLASRGVERGSRGMPLAIRARMRGFPWRAILVGLPLSLGAGRRLAAPARAPRAPTLPLKATQFTLKNGLRLIVVPTRVKNVVSLHIPVRVGSRNEVEPGKSGFAHFFEHIMFKG